MQNSQNNLQVGKIEQLTQHPKKMFIEIDRDKEYRCPACGKLLAKGVIGEAIEIKCPRCKNLCRFMTL